MAECSTPSGKSKWQTFLKKIHPTSSYDVENDQQGIYKTNMKEPCSLVASKSDSDATCIFSPIISSQLDTIYQHRSSIISIAIVGKDMEKANLSIIRRYAGVLFALFATFSYSVATLILKLFQQYHPFTISIWRFQGMILPSLPILLYHICHDKKPIFDAIWPPTEIRTLKNIFFITLRSILGCSSTVLQIYALKYMNMADASVIVYSSPVFVLFVARIFLGEKAGYFSVVIAIFTLSGVFVIARPPMLTGEPLEKEAMLGIIFAFTCMLTATLVYVILRHLREVHYSVVTFCYGVEGTIECLILALSLGVFEFPQTSLEWYLLIGLIVFTWSGQTALILALQLEQCGIVSLISSLDTCFAFAFQFIFLGVEPDMYSLTGASIVIAGVIVTTFRKCLSGLPEDDPTRQRFSFILK